LAREVIEKEDRIEHGGLTEEEWDEELRE